MVISAVVSTPAVVPVRGTFPTSYATAITTTSYGPVESIVSVTAVLVSPVALRTTAVTAATVKTTMSVMVVSSTVTLTFAAAATTVAAATTASVDVFPNTISMVMAGAFTISDQAYTTSVTAACFAATTIVLKSPTVATSSPGVTIAALTVAACRNGVAVRTIDIFGVVLVMVDTVPFTMASTKAKGRTLAKRPNAIRGTTTVDRKMVVVVIGPAVGLTVVSSPAGNVKTTRTITVSFTATSFVFAPRTRIVVAFVTVMTVVANMVAVVTPLVAFSYMRIFSTACLGHVTSAFEV